MVAAEYGALETLGVWGAVLIASGEASSVVVLESVTDIYFFGLSIYLGSILGLREESMIRELGEEA